MKNVVLAIHSTLPLSQEFVKKDSIEDWQRLSIEKSWRDCRHNLKMNLWFTIKYMLSIITNLNLNHKEVL
ncbi:MAG: hypothetical protein JWO53_1317 [Chlamydiia bacterium]|nr:hypothetical protein [Chlamydiia bacterium]